MSDKHEEIGETALRMMNIAKDVIGKFYDEEFSKPDIADITQVVTMLINLERTSEEGIEKIMEKAAAKLAPKLGEATEAKIKEIQGRPGMASAFADMASLRANLQQGIATAPIMAAQTQPAHFIGRFKALVSSPAFLDFVDEWCSHITEGIVAEALFDSLQRRYQENDALVCRIIDLVSGFPWQEVKGLMVPNLKPNQIKVLSGEKAAGYYDRLRTLTNLMKIKAMQTWEKYERDGGGPTPTGQQPLVR